MKRGCVWWKIAASVLLLAGCAKHVTVSAPVRNSPGEPAYAYFQEDGAYWVITKSPAGLAAACKRINKSPCASEKFELYRVEVYGR